jgi:hypothetical protein
VLALIAFLALAGGDGRFFERRDVDFWNARRAAPAEPPADLWSDSAAPPPVKRLLERPTEENARAYLAWQEERFRRLRAAIAAVESARPAGVAPGPVLYFAREGCRWCALQEEELRGIDAVRVPPGSPLWDEFGVTLTPTVVVGGKAFRGLTPRETLLKELRRE